MKGYIGFERLQKLTGELMIRKITGKENYGENSRSYTSF